MPISLVVSSGSTLGHTSAIANFIHVYLFDPQTVTNFDPTTAYIGVSTLRYNSGELLSATAEGGAGAADVAKTVYAFSGLSSKPQKLIARFTSTQATAGTWASGMSETIMATDIAPMQLTASYTDSGGDTINTATIIDFDSKNHDNAGLVTIGASWKFTAPVAGYYQIQAFASFASASWTAGQNIYLILYVNGGAVANLADALVPLTTSNTAYSLHGSVVYKLAATDYFDIRATAPTKNLAAGNSWCSAFLVSRT